MSERRNQRGFIVFMDEPVRVYESSMALRGPHVWLRGGRVVDNEGTIGVVHLSYEEAKAAIEGLRAFIAAADEERTTEPFRDLAEPERQP